MQNLFAWFKKGAVPALVGAVASMFLVVALAQAATTISTSISTAGGYTQSGSSANTFTGATTISGALSATAGATVTTGLTIGSNGSSVAHVIEGTCNLSQSVAGSHAATTSKEYTCAVSGAASGDTVIVTLPPGAGGYLSGSASVYGGFLVNDAFATSSNQIGVQIFNATGAATSSFPQATTTAHYLVIH